VSRRVDQLGAGDSRVDFGTAPMTVSSFCPFLKIMTVGMERMPYSDAMPGDSSVFSFTWSERRELSAPRKPSASKRQQLEPWAALSRNMRRQRAK